MVVNFVIFDSQQFISQIIVVNKDNERNKIKRSVITIKEFIKVA